jgi:hypothetical protein
MENEVNMNLRSDRSCYRASQIFCVYLLSLWGDQRTQREAAFPTSVLFRDLSEKGKATSVTFDADLVMDGIETVNDASSVRNPAMGNAIPAASLIGSPDIATPSSRAGKIKAADVS